MRSVCLYRLVAVGGSAPSLSRCCCCLRTFASSTFPAKQNNTNTDTNNSNTNTNNYTNTNTDTNNSNTNSNSSTSTNNYTNSKNNSTEQSFVSSSSLASVVVVPSSSRLQQTVCQQIERVAIQPIHPLSINAIIKYTAKHPNLDWLCTSACWIQKEMPIRLSHRLHDFNRLPHVVVANVNIQRVYQMYCEGFDQLQRYGPIRGPQQEVAFTKMLIGMVKDHSDVVSLMARGVADLRISHPDILLDSFLDRFFLTRIGNRILAEHHIAHHRTGQDDPDFCGVINRQTAPAKIVEIVAKELQESSLMAYGCCPAINVCGDKDLSFAYIPEHIRYVAHEILKNSVRATIDRHKNCAELPPVQVSIYKGNSDVFIKVFDQGGGISSDVNAKIWNYGFSTVRCDKDNSPDVFGMVSANTLLEMAGYGFGLPLSRLYTRYFGGDLDIKTMQGIGTDTYLLFPRLGDQQESDFMLNNKLYPYTFEQPT
eukprot:GHVS01005012.1.p1 GENE.GHVS01005012.1~~GHVS01005012.1.p1  ORF type:complete len:481 (-),score=61.15 GHVS01005012.1:14-1456(-)